MYYQLPLEQIVRHRNRPSQGDFAHEALTGGSAQHGMRLSRYLP